MHELNANEAPSAISHKNLSSRRLRFRSGRTDRIHVELSEQDDAVAERVKPNRSIRWVLASLALCMLLPSLGTSIANVAWPTLAEAFAASFQQVQWVVLAYL